MADAIFSLRRFYERRARRILPALMLVVAATAPFAWLLMFPHFFLNFAQSLVATMVFANNLLLARTGGYWDLEADLKPLLHTWSLSVEEQFYFILPLMMMALWKFGRSWQITTIALICVASFIASEMGRLQSPSINFFLSTSRAWELLVGCLAAYVPNRPRRIDNALSFAGLTAVFSAILLFDEHTPSPSLYVALPVLGAVAVLLCSRSGTVAYQVLTYPACVGIGLISYSAYLWHQPIFALSRIASLEPPPLFVMIGLALASFGMGLLSWKYVEQPFRNREIVPLHRFVSIILPLYLVMIVLGLFAIMNNGFPSRTFPNGADDVRNYAQYNARAFQYVRESFSNNDMANVLVVGNSVGRDVVNVLIESGIINSEVSIAYRPTIPEELCERSSELEKIAAGADFIAIAIAPGGSNIAAIRRGVDCVRSKSRAEVVIFGPKHFGANINPYANVSVDERERVYSKLRTADIEYNARLKEVFAGQTYIDLLDLLGPDGRTVSIFNADGNPLTADRIHLTRYGAIFLAERFVAAHPALASRLGLPR